jgi:DNA-binding transcriptional MerR regulator
MQGAFTHNGRRDWLNGKHRPWSWADWCLWIGRFDNTNGDWCNERVNTSRAGGVISGPVEQGIGANDAHELAGITYRQLDHWARQGWVLPSLDRGEGRSGRRLYSRSDVVRLDLLRHLAVSKVNTAQAGPLVSELKLGEADMLVLWGPMGGKADLVVVSRAAAVSSLAAGGAWVVYDPKPIRRRLPRVSADADPVARSANAEPARRRSA